MSEKIAVTQRDRDAADELMIHIGGLLPRGNMADVEADIAGMFARHAEAARLAEQERCAKTASAAGNITDWGSDDPECIPEWRAGWIAACDHLFTAIRESQP